ncbi:hypothetical protein [Paraburkholderia madseniana]|nr:hypothetical protein [Paraburkholderia madseniana]
MTRPRWILANRSTYEFIRSYRPPFEAVANRAWLFRTFGIRRSRR